MLSHDRSISLYVLDSVLKFGACTFILNFLISTHVTEEKWKCTQHTKNNDCRRYEASNCTLFFAGKMLTLWYSDNSMTMAMIFFYTRLIHLLYYTTRRDEAFHLSKMGISLLIICCVNLFSLSINIFNICTVNCWTLYTSHSNTNHYLL